MKVEPIIVPVTTIPKETEVKRKKVINKSPKESKSTISVHEVTKEKSQNFFSPDKIIAELNKKIETTSKPNEKIKKTVITEVKKAESKKIIAKAKKKESLKEKKELNEFQEDEKEWAKGPIQEDLGKIEEIRKEEASWKQGPAPSTKRPVEKTYAFTPTPEEQEVMKQFKSERIEKEYLQPTPEEEKTMNELREPDMVKEFKPTFEEMNYLRNEGIVTETKSVFGSVPRTKTGIEGIDTLTNGGIPKNKCIAVVGGPGTGKSIFLMQFLVNGAIKYGEPGVYITFEEEVEELKANYRGFHFDLNELEKRNLVKIVHYSPMRISRFIKNMDVTLRDLIKTMNAKRVVIDSLSAFTLLFENEGEQRESLFNLFQTLKEMDVTTLLSAESWREPTMLAKSGVIEFIADGVIMLYNLKIGDTRVRALEVLKMRGISHESRISPFRITDEGIKVYPEEEVFGVKRKEDM